MRGREFIMKDAYSFDADAEGLDKEALRGKIVVGEFKDEEKEELASQWAALKREVMEEPL